MGGRGAGRSFDCGRGLTRGLPAGASPISAPRTQKRQTPCADYRVDDLVDHLLGSMRIWAAQPGDRGAGVPRRPLSSHRIADAAQVALEAWRKRGLDGTVNMGSAEMPASVAADIS